MKINKPKFRTDAVRSELDDKYAKLRKSKGNPEDEFEEEEQVLTYGLQELKRRRLIPIGKITYNGKPFFLEYPVMTDTTYNVFAFVSLMGGGKTLLSGSNIFTKEFGVVTAKELYDLFFEGRPIHVLSYKEKESTKWSKVKGAMYSGEKELHEVIVEGGARLSVSMDHIMLVWRGEGVKHVRLKDVTTDDWVIFPKYLNAPEGTENPDKEEHARMLGIFIADGNSDSRQIHIANNKFREFILQYFAKYGIDYKERWYNNCWKYQITSLSRVRFKELLGIKEDYCISSNKRIPSWIFEDKSFMRAFIQGLMECDGNFSTKKPTKNRKGVQKKKGSHIIELMLNNREVVNSVAMMLLHFSIRANFRTKMSRATNSNMEAKEYYSLNIRGNDNLRKYIEQIPPFTEFQKERIKDWDIEAAHNSNMRYDFGSWMDKAAKALRFLKISRDYNDYIYRKQFPSDNHRFRNLLKRLDEGGFEDLANEARIVLDNYYMAKIKSIESKGVEKAYDFEVEDKNFLAGDGCGFFVHNSTLVRSMIYYSQKFDPDFITIVFDPMKMEYSKLSVHAKTREAVAKKKRHLLNEMLHDPSTGKPIQVEIEPDSLKVFHLVPRFAIKREVWNDEEGVWEEGFDNTTIQIMNKDGGFIWAEDASTMTEDQLFTCLNYRELRTNQAIHFYLRQAIKLCNSRFGVRKWFIGDLIQVLKEGVKKYMSASEVDDLNDAEADKKTGLSSLELQLIEQLEKYNDAGFFVRNLAERKRFGANFRKFIRLGRILNISFLGFKKTEKVGEDFVVGQSDLILERLIAISNEYYDGVRKQEAGLPLSEWEEYLLRRWKVSLWFEESEIFIPRDCASTDIKKWPCIKRLDYLMSVGRKFGFKNFGFITQRVQKINPFVFKDSNNIFLGPMVGEERDRILNDFGVNKIKFQVPIRGQVREVTCRDIVSTLSKDRHEWLFINKMSNTNAEGGDIKIRIAPVRTFDSPCG